MSKVESNAAQTFENWYKLYFDENLKKGLNNAFKKGLTPLYNQVKDRVRNSGLKNANEMLGGVILRTNISKESNRHYGLVSVLGNKGKGNLIRIFELGTYKTPSHNIKPYNFLTNADSSTSSNLIISNLQETIRNINNG